MMCFYFQDNKNTNNQELSHLKNEIRQLKTQLLAKDAEIDSLKEQLKKNGITDKTVQSEIFKLLGQLENEVNIFLIHLKIVRHFKLLVRIFIGENFI